MNDEHEGLNSAEVQEILANRFAEEDLEEPETGDEPESYEPGEEASDGSLPEGFDGSEPVEEPEEPQNASYQQLDGAYQALMRDAHAFQQQYQSVDWERLRKEDPDRYAAEKINYNEVAQRFATRERQIVGAAQKLTKEAQTKEEQKLLKAIPSWRDPNIANKEKAEMVEYLRGKGYNDAEISNFTKKDILVTREAMKKADPPRRKTIPRLQKNKKFDGIAPWKQRLLEKESKRRPGGTEDIVLRLLRNGHV